MVTQRMYVYMVLLKCNATHVHVCVLLLLTLFELCTCLQYSYGSHECNTHDKQSFTNHLLAIKYIASYVLHCWFLLAQAHLQIRLYM